MAIRKPTNLVVNFSADLQTDAGNGRVNNVSQLSYSEVVPYSSYATGSLELLTSDQEVVIGSLSVGVFTANAPVEFRLEGSTDTILSRSFSYNGAVTTIYANNTSVNTNPITIEYIIGTKL